MDILTKLDEMHADPNKGEARAKVFDHLNSYTVDRLITLPGTHWEIEDEFLKQGTHITAFEREDVVVQEILKTRLRAGVIQTTLHYPQVGRGRLKNPATVWQSSRTTLIQEDLAKFLASQDDASLVKYGDWDGVWIDLCGCFGKTDAAPLNSILLNLHRALVPVTPIPIAITISTRREHLAGLKGTGIEGRVQLAVALLEQARPFILVDYHDYHSTKGTPMVVLLGEYW